jgi:uncharacterized protein with HEPN domain
MRGSLERLADMLEAIEKIEKYAARGRNVFESEELVQTWVVHHLQILGEAARAMPQAIRDKIPQVAWSKIIGMRHILVHNYFKVDCDIVWAVIEVELPKLRREITEAIFQIQHEST